MKGGTLQIAWHGSDPVLTLDFHSTSGLLATGGADHDIKLWSLHSDETKSLPSATFVSSLSYHTAAVNVLRFSPSGDQLASGSDGGELLIWRYNESLETANGWKVLKALRFHHKDVLDLEWSSDGASLISGSVDNSVIIWDVTKGIPLQVLEDHLHYVQGVAWDPAGQFIASISGDRTCRIYSNRPQTSKVKMQEKTLFSCQNVVVKEEAHKQDGDASAGKGMSKYHLFHDETLPSFFRRLAWSPDGSFLLVPSGIHKFSAGSASSNTTYILSRRDLSRYCSLTLEQESSLMSITICNAGLPYSFQELASQLLQFVSALFFSHFVQVLDKNTSMMQLALMCSSFPIGWCLQLPV
eukprot:c19416_g1_i3 orf=1289-2350(-)